MIATETIVQRQTESVRPGQRYKIAVFSGGNHELEAMLNNLPTGWRLVSAELATNPIFGASALFEITPVPSNGEFNG